jgi:CheY-specific phosphatase CheX
MLTEVQNDVRLCEAITRVLEQMFFEAIVEPPRAGRGIPDDLIAVEVRFGGTQRGRLRLAVPQSAAEALAANFLGLTPGDPVPESASRFVVAEMGNMICGSYLSAIDPEGEFRLDTPEPCSRTDGDWIRADLSSGFIAVAISIDPSITGGVAPNRSSQ